jgi:hypothetical protein
MGRRGKHTKQIGAELAPYMQQMMPSVTAAPGTTKEVVARANQRIAEEMPAATALTAAATASRADQRGRPG